NGWIGPRPEFAAGFARWASSCGGATPFKGDGKVARGGIPSQPMHFRIADSSPRAETSSMGLPHFGHRSRCVSKKPPQNPTVAVSWSNDNGNKWLNPLTRGIGAQDLSKTTHIQQVEHRGGFNIGATDADDVWAILLLYWKIGRSRSRQTFGVHPDSPTVIWVRTTP